VSLPGKGSCPDRRLYSGGGGGDDGDSGGDDGDDDDDGSSPSLDFVGYGSRAGGGGERHVGYVGPSWMKRAGAGPPGRGRNTNKKSLRRRPHCTPTTNLANLTQDAPRAAIDGTFLDAGTSRGTEEKEGVSNVGVPLAAKDVARDDCVAVESLRSIRMPPRDATGKRGGRLGPGVAPATTTSDTRRLFRGEKMDWRKLDWDGTRRSFRSVAFWSSSSGVPEVEQQRSGG
jgi:hypothetical protein